MDDEVKHFCKDHQINFPTNELLEYHLDTHCSEMLKEKNICTFLKEKGTCCRRVFRQTSALLYHYLNVHKVYACYHCYQLFTTISELDDHDHLPDISVRESKRTKIIILF